MPDTTWITAVAHLRTHREPGVLVTVATVRGHAPRDAGAKLVVAHTRTWAPSAAATSKPSPSTAPAT